MIGKTLSHYRIIAKIGAGGMGEVYRAHDEQLERDIALKILTAGTLTGESARKQFRKEALALAKLNHPNIETVFEFSSQDGLDFLAMELIPGHTLSEMLKDGPLTEREIVRLGIQFTEGMAAAHEQGVIHRDLKPGNLMVTPEGRLKILDFGLARLMPVTANPDVTRSITQEPAKVAGTVPYMAPEQLRGERVDVRADLYAAGAVLYEMATGKRAFSDEQPLRLIDSILHKAPPSPRALNPLISSSLEAIIQRAMEKEPASRYQTARNMLAVLEGSSSGISPGAPSKGPGLLLAAKAGGIFLTAVLGLAFGLNLGGLRDRLLVHSSAEHRSQPSVAVLTFKNVSQRPDQAWLSVGLSEMLTTELARGDELRTIPGEDVALMKMDLSLRDEDSYGQDTLKRIHKNLNADKVVVGSYVPLGEGQIRLDLRLQDAVQGETLAVISEKGSEDHMDDLVSRAGVELRDKLGVGAGSATEAAKTKVPSNPQAEYSYFDALIVQRARQLLHPPAGVTLSEHQGKLYVEGTASPQWIASLADRAQLIAGIKSIDVSHLQDSHLLQLKAPQSAIESVFLLFPVGRAELEPGQENTFTQTQKQIRDIVAQAEHLGEQTSIELIGHTDSTGIEGTNQLLGQQRAEQVRARLLRGGVPPANLRLRGVGTTQPLVSGDTEESRRLNRSVTFKITFTPTSAVN